MTEEERKAGSSSSLSRRKFIIGSGAAAGVALTGLAATPEDGERNRSDEPAPHPVLPYGSLLDVNVDLFRWPLRRLRFDEPGAIATKLRSHGVERAWTGSYEGLLHKDLAGVNARLAEACRESSHSFLVPFGSVNPAFADWGEELRRCHEEHKMPGIRLHPDYHGYALDDRRFAQLLAMAAERGMIVQLSVQMEDERMMHPRLRVDPVDTTPLAQIVKGIPRLRLVLLNAMRQLRGDKLTELVGAGEVYLEIAALEGIGGIEKLLAQVPVSRVLFGSHAPLFYFESALLKLKESPLNDEQLESIVRTNATRLMGG